MFYLPARMANLNTMIEIYDPGCRVNRIRKLTVEGPELVLDCLERDTSCLDLQMLSEAADASPSCKITFDVTITPIKRGQRRL